MTDQQKSVSFLSKELSARSVFHLMLIILNWLVVIFIVCGHWQTQFKSMAEINYMLASILFISILVLFLRIFGKLFSIARKGWREHIAVTPLTSGEYIWGELWPFFRETFILVICILPVLILLITKNIYGSPGNWDLMNEFFTSIQHVKIWMVAMVVFGISFSLLFTFCCVFDSLESLCRKEQQGMYSVVFILAALLFFAVCVPVIVPQLTMVSSYFITMPPKTTEEMEQIYKKMLDGVATWQEIDRQAKLIELQNEAELRHKKRVIIVGNLLYILINPTLLFILYLITRSRWRRLCKQYYQFE